MNSFVAAGDGYQTSVMLAAEGGMGGLLYESHRGHSRAPITTNIRRKACIVQMTALRLKARSPDLWGTPAGNGGLLIWAEVEPNPRGGYREEPKRETQRRWGKCGDNSDDRIHWCLQLLKNISLTEVPFLFFPQSKNKHDIIILKEKLVKFFSFRISSQTSKNSRRKLLNNRINALGVISKNDAKTALYLLTFISSVFLSA